MKSMLIAASLLTCGVTSSACVTGSSEGVGDERLTPAATADIPAAGVIAVVETDDGATVRFSEPAPGEIDLESTPGNAGADPLAHLDLDALDATEVYEALTGAPAPAALVAAQRRLDTVMEKEEEVAPLEDGEAESAPFAPLTSAQFEQLYCPGYAFCRLNRTGYMKHETWAKRVRGYIYASDGQIRLSIRRKRVTGWYQVETHDQPPGAEPHRFSHSWSIRRPVKVEVYEAIGNTYHISYEF